MARQDDGGVGEVGGVGGGVGGVRYEWRGEFDAAEVEELHAEAFGHPPDAGYDWRGQLERHSLGWVVARGGADGALLGFVNVAWDGAAHAFLLDTSVARRARRAGIGAALVAEATRGARDAGCEWLHVDFEEHLRPFYFGSCGFTETRAGLVRLRG
ncbi:GNAT family N-acetyltransferase [Streptomyces hoynatensis]|uniref:GNAT family N-acetyltransferase n=1 Tax=Streptomyces hoynatensis TaxID=1141874 RepID=A0A3A9YNF4_9ACTN|nr:GNAT family N-acetyltransferase [Streptomyces hoynatensis]RKN37771.1 GNAT family N-acetyltransferase [Streptomyces hoynatensis]